MIARVKQNARSIVRMTYIQKVTQGTKSVHLDQDPVCYARRLENTSIWKKPPLDHLNVYLGGKIRRVELENGSKSWAFTPLQYVQEEAMKDVEAYLKRRDQNLALKAGAPMATGYRNIQKLYFSRCVMCKKWFSVLDNTKISASWGCMGKSILQFLGNIHFWF